MKVNKCLFSLNKNKHGFCKTDEYFSSITHGSFKTDRYFCLTRLEESFINKRAASVDYDDSSEELSDCSMENNRSGNSSPVSSIEEKLMPLAEGEPARSSSLT